MKLFHFTDRKVGNDTYCKLLKNVSGGGELHDTLLHCCKFDTSKVIIKILSILLLIIFSFYPQKGITSNLNTFNIPNNSNSNHKKIQYYTGIDTLTYFKEIGDKSIMKKFPEKWNISVYQATSHNDSINERKFYKITNYYKSIKGIEIKNIDNYRKILEGGQIDSLHLIHRFFKNGKIYEYIKSVKSIENDEGFPSNITSIDILVFKDKKYLGKFNVYYEKNYSYAISYKLGYLDKNGVLFYKIFETDEVETHYVKENKDYLLFSLKVMQ